MYIVLISSGVITYKHFNIWDSGKSSSPGTNVEKAEIRFPGHMSYPQYLHTFVTGTKTAFTYEKDMHLLYSDSFYRHKMFGR
jgi:hypothetical protein